MRVAAVAVVLIAALVGLACGQAGGHIGIYSDNPGFSDCSLPTIVGVPHTIYVAHVVGLEATAVRFSIQENWDGPIDVDFGENAATGDIFTGVTVVYPQCELLPHLIATLQFTPLTVEPPCTKMFEVVPALDSTSGQIEVTDCSVNCRLATGGRLVVNTIPQCPCSPHPLRSQILSKLGGTLQCDPVATETSTWGAIKALYH